MTTPRHAAGWSLLVLLLLAPLAHAQAVRAWLDRDRIALGETATLNIQVDGPGEPPPDYAPLLRDFRASGHSSSRSYREVNGRSERRTLYAVALQPLREGVVAIPPLQVAGATTPPLTLEVASTAVRPAQAGDPVFVEAQADARAPWVQQAVGYVVRLYSAVPLVSGQLDQAEPDGATLQRVGEDLRYSRDIDGRSYTVIERHYLLIPERSGPLTIPGARFSGRGISGFFDDFFGDGQAALAANAAPRTLDVRAIPATARQPWLPLRDLRLRWADAPVPARAGEALQVTLEAEADGATAAQLPELRLPVPDAAQVFADPAQVDERFVDGRPQVTVRRTFSIVPGRAGPLTIEAPRLSWWDVDRGEARTTGLPPLVLQVAQGRAPPPPGADTGAGDEASAAPALDASGNAGLRLPGVQDPVRPWALATVLFALAWLVTLAWGLQRKSVAGVATRPHGGGAAGPAPMSLVRALERGDLDDIGSALCAAATPPVADLESLQARLPGPQREAVQALQRARWGDGDAAAARTLLRQAFRDGIAGASAAATDAAPLPPLYP